MARQPFSKVKSGQSLEIPAREYNALLDAALPRKESRPDDHHDGGVVGTLRAHFRNDHSSPLPSFSVLGISRDQIIARPEDDLEFFKFRYRWIGVTPTADHVTRFMVTQSPVHLEEFGRAVIVGPTPCQVLINTPSDEFANALPGVVTHLTSTETGAARILWREEPDATGMQWCIVALNAGAGGGGEGVRLATIKEIDGFNKLDSTYSYVNPHSNNTNDNSAIATFCNQNLCALDEKDGGTDFIVYWDHMTASQLLLEEATDIVVDIDESGRWQLINAECENAIPGGSIDTDTHIQIAYNTDVVTTPRDILNITGNLAFVQDNPINLQTDLILNHDVYVNGTFVGNEAITDFVGGQFTGNVGSGPTRNRVTFLRTVHDDNTPVSSQPHWSFQGMAVPSDNPGQSRVDVDVNLTALEGGILRGIRPQINFIDSGSVTWDIDEDVGNDWITVTATSIGGGGGLDRRDWFDEGTGPLADRDSVDVVGVPVDLTVRDASFWELRVTAYRFVQDDGGTSHERPTVNLFGTAVDSILDNPPSNRTDISINRHAIQDSGSLEAHRPTLDFRDNLTVTDLGGKLIIDAAVSGGSRHQIKDEGTPVTDAPVLNILGTPISAVYNGGTDEIDITVGAYREVTWGSAAAQVRSTLMFSGTAVMNLTGAPDTATVTIDRHAIQDSGADRPDRPTISFRNNLTVTDSGGVLIVDASGGGGGARHVIHEEGTPLADRPNLDFRGPAITASDFDANNTRVTVQAYHSVDWNGSFSQVRDTLRFAGTAIAGLTGSTTIGTITIDRHGIQTGGVPFANRAKLDFIGNAVTIDDDPGGDRLLFTIDRHVVKNSVGTLIPNREVLQFRNNLTVSDDGTNIIIDAAAGGGGGARHIIMDEGTPLTDRPNLNFAGVCVVASDNGGSNRTDVTITAVKDLQWEGGSTVTRSIVDLRGTAVKSIVDTGTSARFRIDRHTFLDHGNALLDHDTINLVGNAVGVTQGGGVTSVSINNRVIQDHGVAENWRGIMDFTGNAVAVTDDSILGKTLIDINRHLIRNAAGTTMTNRHALQFRNNLTITDNGTTLIVDATAGGGSRHTIMDEGTPLADQPNLNFAGVCVAATNNPGLTRTDVTVTAIKDTVINAGSAVITRSILDLGGSAVISLVDTGSASRYTINRHEFRDHGAAITDHQAVNFTGNAVAYTSPSSVSTFTINNRVIQDHGVAETWRDTLDFTGNAVAVIDTGSKLSLVIQRHVVKNSVGTQQANRDFIQFRNNLTVTDDGTNIIVDAAAGGGGGARHIIMEEGTPLSDRPNLDFRGVAITATDHDANTTRVTVQAIKDARFGSTLVTRNIIDLAGSAVVSLVDSGSSANYTINRHAFQSQGSPLTDRANVNLGGTAVSGNSAGSTITYTINNRVLTNNGVPATHQPTLDFTGNAVSLSNDSGNSRTRAIINKHFVQGSSGTDFTDRRAIRFRNNLSVSDLGGTTNAVAVDAVFAFSIQNESGSAITSAATGLNFVGQVVHANMNGSVANVTFQPCSEVLFGITSPGGPYPGPSIPISGQGNWDYSHFIAAGPIPGSTPVAAARIAGSGETPKIFAVLC